MLLGSNMLLRSRDVVMIIGEATTAIVDADIGALSILDMKNVRALFHVACTAEDGVHLLEADAARLGDAEDDKGGEEEVDTRKEIKRVTICGLAEGEDGK